ncbi:MAG: extracellular solute-binding protein, partial [Lawsonibacter sp.]|nr:extracellular solute-binding protein [Lawsonibacter sp.]
MKKILSVLLASAMLLSLAACGGGNGAQSNQGGQSSAGNQSGTSQGSDASTPADPMAELIDAAKAEGELVVYGSCEEEYLAAACQKFEQLYGIKTTFQRLSTGEVQAKIEEENGNPSADVWFGGTTDPYNVVAAEGLLEPYEAMNASHITKDVYKHSDNMWHGIYTGILGFMVNKDRLESKGLEAPKDWPDL